ncbi:MAG: hypothetical protein M0Z80_11080 [Treponema sp.]|nr:hypothetical protein [Treponema sp.]
MGIFPSLFRRAVPLALAFLALACLALCPPCRAQDLSARAAEASAVPASPARAAAPAEGGGSPARGASIFAAELGAGPLVGLDRPLRGGELSAALLLDLGSALGPGYAGLMPGLEAVVLYDLSFQAAAACADLVFSLGSELRFALGCEAPLGGAALSVDGASLALAAGAWPNRFAVTALLGELGGLRGGGPEGGGAGREVGGGGAGGGPEGGGAGPRLSLEVELGWSAYRLADEAAVGRLAAAQSGIRGFAAGFRMGSLLRLRWGPRH